jgi:hypothetical protein
MKTRIKIWITPEEAERIKKEVFLSEYLRYAGLVSRPEIDYSSKKWFIRVSCPRGYDVKEWSRMNIERLKSFGVTAEFVA